MRANDTPSYAQISTVPVASRLTVSAAHTDGNGHMNVRHIYAAGVTGADTLSELAGVDDSYRAGEAMGTFAAEHHITFFAEIHQGAEVAARPLWIDRSERAAHLLIFITDESQRRLSAVLEMIIINMDLRARRPSPFPLHVASRITSGAEASRSLGFSLPLCGAMGVQPR